MRDRQGRQWTGTVPLHRWWAGRAQSASDDPSNARDALRFVSEMLQAGTAEEVVQQVLLSDQRDQWSALLRSLVDDGEEMGWTRSEGSEEVVRLQEQLSAATATIAAMEEANEAELDEVTNELQDSVQGRRATVRRSQPVDPAGDVQPPSSP